MKNFLISDDTTATGFEVDERCSIFHASPGFSPHADFQLRFARCFVFLALAIIGFMAIISGAISVSPAVQSVVFALPPLAFVVCVLRLLYFQDAHASPSREPDGVIGK